MSRLFRSLLLVTAISLPHVAHAGTEPKYEPAPEWVVQASLLTAEQAKKAGPLLLADAQVRIEGNRVWNYTDRAYQVETPELLANVGQLAMSWYPDKGDFYVHELSILRDGEKIDAVAQGQRFTVLQREENLEARELTGVLTATLAIEGLRVGDILRMRTSTTLADDALDGEVQAQIPLVADPIRIGDAPLSISWERGADMRWRPHAEGVVTELNEDDGFARLEIDQPLKKQTEMPSDAPARYKHVPLIEFSTFDDWSEVSRVMAPFYETGNAIAANGPIAAEVAKIMRAESDPLARAARALQLVQDEIRYLLVGMDGGNYIPQSADRTWAVRYGDCKAKTLLLLAILHEMEIEAEPVLAHLQLGDFVPDRLPSAAAFNHVLVRAKIAGEDIWLDGTGAGTRLGDIRNTPTIGHVLPVRPTGAELVEIDMKPDARPSLFLSMIADESATIDLPSVVDIEAVVRGAAFSHIASASAQATDKQRRNMLENFLERFIGDVSYDEIGMTTDESAGTVTIAAQGISASAWDRSDRRASRWFSLMPYQVQFQPDRARSAWRAIPFYPLLPERSSFEISVRLPDAGEGFTIKGQNELDVTAGGRVLSRDATLTNGVAKIREDVAGVGREIPPALLPEARRDIARILAQSPVLSAPADATRVWQLDGRDPRGATQVRRLLEVADGAVARARADDPSALGVRLGIRMELGDFQGALKDMAAALEIAPSSDLYLSRSAIHALVGDYPAAVADSRYAVDLAPSSNEAIKALSGYLAIDGDLDEAVGLLDERIDYGGEHALEFRMMKAAMVGEHGDVDLALSQFDDLVAENPQRASLLNDRCWTRVIRNIDMEQALADCTQGIEITDNPAPFLDSRALAYWRLGRYDEALKDIDAALLQSPSGAEYMYTRGLILHQIGRKDEAKTMLKQAARRYPGLANYYGRYGLKP